MHRRAALLNLAAVGLLCSSRAHAAPTDISVIVNPAVPVGVLDAASLRLIFQVVELRWPDDKPIVPINLVEDSAIRQAFDLAVLGLTPDKVARYWIDRRIRGDVRPPRKAASASLALRTVAKLPGAISYVESGEASSLVKIVARIRNGKVVRP